MKLLNHVKQLLQINTNSTNIHALLINSKSVNVQKCKTKVDRCYRENSSNMDSIALATMSVSNGR